MEFKKYSSIENSYQSRFVERAIYSLDGYDDFIVQEKVHGANFAFYVDGNGISCAKRTSILLADEKFFSYQEVLKKHEGSLRKLYGLINKPFVLFGEIYGGGIQKEVFYSEEKKFYGFDILIDDNIFLSTDEVNDFLLLSEIPFAKTLFRGTLEECFKYDVNINSIIAEELPKYLNGINVMEGVVIRPNESKWMGHMDNVARIIFKKKTEGFSEKKAPDKIPSNPTKYQRYDCYIMRQRLNNIVSKYGEITDKKELPVFAGYLVKDICEDYEKDNGEIDDGVSKYLHSKCIKFILSELF